MTICKRNQSLQASIFCFVWQHSFCWKVMRAAPGERNPRGPVSVPTRAMEKQDSYTFRDIWKPLVNHIGALCWNWNWLRDLPKSFVPSKRFTVWSLDDNTTNSNTLLFAMHWLGCMNLSIATLHRISHTYIPVKNRVGIPAWEANVFWEGAKRSSWIHSKSSCWQPWRAEQQQQQQQQEAQPGDANHQELSSMWFTSWCWFTTSWCWWTCSLWLSCKTGDWAKQTGSGEVASTILPQVIEMKHCSKGKQK